MIIPKFKIFNSCFIYLLSRSNDTLKEEKVCSSHMLIRHSSRRTIRWQQSSMIWYTSCIIFIIIQGTSWRYLTPFLILNIKIWLAKIINIPSNSWKKMMFCTLTWSFFRGCIDMVLKIKFWLLILLRWYVQLP